MAILVLPMPFDSATLMHSTIAQQLVVDGSFFQAPMNIMYCSHNVPFIIPANVVVIGHVVCENTWCQIILLRGPQSWVWELFPFPTSWVALSLGIFGHKRYEA